MNNKWLIVFLGNPGREYEKTRHNAGFIIAQELFPDGWSENKYSNSLERSFPDEYRTEVVTSPVPSSLMGEGQGGGGIVVDAPLLSTIRADVFAIMPQTFMNLSGKAVRYYCEKEHIKRDQVIVVYDDVDIMVGNFKLSQGRGDGNHNGIKSIINQLGTKNFIRIRIGVGSPDRYPGLADYVMGKFREEEYVSVNGLAPKIQKCIADVIFHGAQKAMNTYNS